MCALSHHLDIYYFLNNANTSANLHKKVDHYKLYVCLHINMALHLHILYI